MPAKKQDSEPLPTYSKSEFEYLSTAFEDGAIKCGECKNWSGTRTSCTKIVGVIGTKGTCLLAESK